MFTVVIPLYNKESTIEETLRSVLNQTFFGSEIIVVNDGSTDGSREKAAEVAGSRIKIIDQPNKGVSAARNRGILQSSNPYIATLDGDDVWLPEYLEEQKKMIDDFPDAGMWGVAWDTWRNDKRTRKDHGIEKDFRGYIDNYFTMDKKGHLFMPSSTVLEKNTLKALGLYDESIYTGEDLDVFYRILLRYRTAFYNKPLMLYDTGIKNSLSSIKHDIKYWFYYDIDKYEEQRTANPEFRKYFDNLVLRYMYSYRLDDDYSQDVDEVLSRIDFSLQPRRWWWLYKFPGLYKFYKKIRR